jgi:DNA-binding transcriptional MerR regulator
MCRYSPAILSMLPTDRQYTIQEISQALDLPKSTLRYWEKRLEGLIQPLRSKGGQRRYLSEQIETLRRIKRMKRRGVNLSDIQSQLLEEQMRPLTDLNEQHIQYVAERVAELVKKEISNYLNHIFDQEIKKMNIS